MARKNLLFFALDPDPVNNRWNHCRDDKLVEMTLKKMNTHHFYDDKEASLVPMNIHNVLPYMKKYVELNLI